MNELITKYEPKETGARVGFSDKPAENQDREFSWCATASAPAAFGGESQKTTFNRTFGEA